MTWADTDEQLVARVRSGELDAYDVLFERHNASARRVARAALGDATDVDDVVAEAFASVLGALQRGNGPREGFVGYLVSTVRHEAFRANRRRRDRPVGDGTHEPAVDPFAGREDADVLRVAFGSLPSVSRDVLWHTEVEGRSHADIARSIGSTTQAIGARASRARVALGGAYLAGHLDLAFDQPPSTPQCSEVRAQLVDLVRGGASNRRRRALEAHLAQCARCREGRERLERFNERLRTAPPLVPVAAAGSVSLLARLAPVLAGAVAAATLAVTAVVAPPRGEAGGRIVNDDPATTAPATTQVVRDEPAGTTTLRHVTVATDPPPPDSVAVAVPTTAPPVTAPPAPPAVTQPSAPVSTAPIVTEPAVSAPPGTVPPETTPLLAVPSLTVPSLTVPSLTVPSLTVPSLTVPSISLPLITTPAISTPVITTPVITTPAITTPAISTPIITIPPLLGP